MPPSLPHLTPAALLTVCLLTGCSHGHHDHQPVSSTTTRPPSTTEATTTAPPSPEAEVRAAYLGAMKAYFEMGQAPDPTDRRIARWFTGSARLRVIQVLKGLDERGIHVRYEERPSPTIETIAVEGDHAVVRVCLIDRSVQAGPSGKVVDDDETSTRSNAHLSREHRRWRISHADRIQRWNDPGGCER